jgi:hypothetical protein
MAQHGFDYEAMRRRALYSALMSASSGFMQAGAPSLLPGGNQAALGQGLMGATQGYNNSMMDIAGMRQQDQRYNAEQERLKAARNYRIGRDVLADTRYTETQGYNRGRDTAGDALSAEALTYDRGRDTAGDLFRTAGRAYDQTRDAAGDALSAEALTYDRGRDTAGDLFRTAGRSYDQARDTAGDAFRDEDRTYDRGQDLEAAAIAAEKVEFERANPGLKHAATFPKKHLANGQIQLQKYNPDGTLSDYGSPYWPTAMTEAEAQDRISAKMAAGRGARMEQPANSGLLRILGLSSGTYADIEAAGLGSFDPDTKEKVKLWDDLGDQRIAALELGRSVEVLIEKARNNPAAMGAAGGLAGWINNFTTDLKNMAFNLGVDVSVNADDVGAVEGRLAKAGVVSGEIRSAAAEMLYMKAIALGQHGKALSDKDIQQMAKIIGARHSNLEMFAQAMSGMADRTAKAVRLKINEKLNANIPPIWIPEKGYEDRPETSGKKKVWTMEDVDAELDRN